ncbi:MAG: lipoyl(octanoyl) transferase LipB [Chloroflexi bacterium]|nr:lipoyl(octanoyl) transferase LipB [Chloroflexota bacterium]
METRLSENSLEGNSKRTPVQLLCLGRWPYKEALALQHRIVAARQAGLVGNTLILLEHEPVITIGRAGDAGHILAGEDDLRAAGIRIYRVERGGDVTYHGPGQLVGYPILRLADYGLGVSDYMHHLEETIIRTLADFGIGAGRLDNIIGVWVGGAKIAALGARIEGGVTYHGFALNVDPDLSHFDFIVPCGITNCRVTSMRLELGRQVNIETVRERLTARFSEVFGVAIEPTRLEEMNLPPCAA